MKQVFYSDVTKKYYETEEECLEAEEKVAGANAKKEKALKEFNEAKDGLAKAIEVYNTAAENLRKVNAENNTVKTITFDELINHLFGLPLTK